MKPYPVEQKRCTSDPDYRAVSHTRDDADAREDVGMPHLRLAITDDQVDLLRELLTDAIDNAEDDVREAGDTDDAQL